MTSNSSPYRTYLRQTAAAATFLTALWLAYWAGKIAPPGVAPDGPLWHGHEMVYGFLTVLALALLSSESVPRGKAWLAVPVLWVLARIGYFLFPPGPVVAVIDLLFLPAVAVWGPRPKQTGLYFGALGLLFVGNALIHADQLGIWEGGARYGLYLGLDTLLLAASIACPRWLPVAAAENLPGYTLHPLPFLNWLANGATLLFLVCDVLTPFSDLTTAAAVLCAVAHFARFWKWRDDRVWQQPSLWILFIGYLWLVAGFILRVYANLFAFPVDVIAHAFSAGAISVLGYGAVARRDSHRGLAFGFWLINLAAAARVFLPLYLASHYDAIVIASGVLWAGAFVVLVCTQWSVLILAKTDPA